ncbi:MAG: (Fe-S)-binding protein [Bacteroidota bacterium]
MKVGLFIPCYIDQLYPQVGIATLQLLEKLGTSVAFPASQTCCGQPMANAGFEHLTPVCTTNFLENFSPFQYIVCPSGSCTLHLKEQLHGEPLSRRVFELTEFLTDVMEVKQLASYFPHRVGLHQGCHGLRGLNLASMSERVLPPFSKPVQLLKLVKGVDLVPLQLPDECCGFGGTFSVMEDAVSARMGIDRVRDHEQAGAEYITSADMSCLMHLEGIIKRQRSTLKVIHLAEILNAS